MGKEDCKTTEDIVAEICTYICTCSREIALNHIIELLHDEGFIEKKITTHYVSHFANRKKK